MLKPIILAFIVLVERVDNKPTGIRILSDSSLPKSLVGRIDRPSILIYDSWINQVIEIVLGIMGVNARSLCTTSDTYLEATQRRMWIPSFSDGIDSLG